MAYPKARFSGYWCSCCMSMISKPLSKNLISFCLPMTQTCFLQIKWDANCESDNCYKPNWKTAYKPAFRCTKSTEFANFHYRFLHRILPTNCFLTRIGLKNNSICTFCGDFPEELCHLFWYCKKYSFLGDDLILWLKEKAIIPDIYQKSMTVLLGLKPENCHVVS